MVYLFLAAALLMCAVMLFLIFFKAISTPIFYIKNTDVKKILPYLKQAEQKGCIYIVIGCDKNAGNDLS